MNYLPRWLISKFKKDDFRCPSCDTKFAPSGVYAAGVKDSYNDKTKSVPFIEYCCPNCKDRKMVELPIESTLIEFAASIIDDIDAEIEEMNRQDRPVRYHKKGVRKAKRRDDPDEKEPEEESGGKSRITKDEMRKAIKLMNDSKFWEDFLKKIGAPMEFAYLDPMKDQEKKDEQDK